MAFYAGLMGANAGEAQGHAQAYQDAITLSMQQQQQQEQAREFDANLKLQQEQLGLDPATGQPIKPVIPKQFSQILPHNKGKGQPTPEDYVNHYLQLASANVENPSVSQAFSNIAQQYGLGAERSANAAYTAGPKSALGYASANLADAHAKYILTIQPKEFQQKIGEDRDKFMQQIASRNELAQYNLGGRMQVAAITAYYRYQGQSQENAFRAALDEYNQAQQDYRTDTRDALNPLSPTYGTFPQAPGAPTMPYTTPGSTNVTVNLGDVLKAINAKGPAVRAGDSGAKPPTGDPGTDAAAIVDEVVKGLHGKPNAGAQLSLLLSTGNITPQEAAAIAHRLGVTLSGSQSGIQVPNAAQALGIGGSNGTAPFH